MRSTIVFATVLGSLAVLATPSFSSAQPYRRDFTNGIRDAAAKANGDQYYFYTREAATQEGPIRPMLGGSAAVVPTTAQRSFSRNPAATGLANRDLMQAPTLPISVIQAQAGELRTDLQNATGTYETQSRQYKGNPQATMHLDREHQHRLSALKGLDRLQADRRGSQAANNDARAVQSELAAASSEHSWFVQSTQGGQPTPAGNR